MQQPESGLRSATGDDSGSASATPWRTVIDADEPGSMRNCLAIPGLLGDPFTAFDVDAEAGEAMRHGRRGC
jgi:hypothetical protein